MSTGSAIPQEIMDCMRECCDPAGAVDRPQEILTIANQILGKNQLSLAKYLFISAYEDNPKLTNTTIVHWIIQEMVPECRSKVVFALPGHKENERWLLSFRPDLAGKTFSQHAKRMADTGRTIRLEEWCNQVAHLDWTGITDDQLTDMPGFAAETVNTLVNWGCEGPFIIDARSKPHHAPALIKDEAVERKEVDTLGDKGGIAVRIVKRVLLIDDEHKLRTLLARIIGLEGEGYEVTEVDGLKPALKQLNKTDYDVVLCDVKLPDGDGVSFIPQIKAVQPFAEVILADCIWILTGGPGSIPKYYNEAKGNPAISGMGIDISSGNTEGKETRFGAIASGYWSIATTVISTGSINAMHDSSMPLSAANNGSGFEGLGDNTLWWNVSTGFVLILSRFLPIIGPVAIAGLLAAKNYIPEGSGTLKTDTATFGLMVFALCVCIFRQAQCLRLMVFENRGDVHCEKSVRAGDAGLHAWTLSRRPVPGYVFGYNARCLWSYFLRFMFANLAGSFAEAEEKAQADSPSQTREETFPEKAG
ncbi:hypothetical protein FQR65_LT17400 [Abscondita terminalis]|nr:hypothetical protein FQR65_LT17400 [Abscondita terminalis]